MTSSENTRIENLTNIGKTVAANLRLLGVHTRGDLARATPVSVYLHLCENFPQKIWPKCYYLYSLEGALTNTRWENISDDKKQQLVQEVKKRQLKLTRPDAIKSVS